MNTSKQLTINMIANFVNFGISLCISFFYRHTLSERLVLKQTVLSRWRITS